MFKKIVTWVPALLTALGILVFFEYYYLVSNNITFTSEQIFDNTIGLWGILLIFFIIMVGFIPIMDLEGICKFLFLLVLATITIIAETVLFLNQNENVGVQTILMMINVTLFGLTIFVIVPSAWRK